MNPTKILLGNNLVSTLVMPLSTLPPVSRPPVSPSDVRGAASGATLITIKVQAPDDEDQEDSSRDKEEDDICRVSLT